MLNNIVGMLLPYVYDVNHIENYFDNFAGKNIHISAGISRVHTMW